METERKFLLREFPGDPGKYKSRFIEQGYLCVDPVVRVRRDDDTYYMTYKGEGVLSHEEYNLPLNAGAYGHLLKKADGNIISKRRYMIPLGNYTAETDIFEGIFKGIVMAEIEFPSANEAMGFVPPSWFGLEVTQDERYHNNFMSRMKEDEARKFAETSPVPVYHNR